MLEFAIIVNSNGRMSAPELSFEVARSLTIFVKWKVLDLEYSFCSSTVAGFDLKEEIGRAFFV